MATQVVWTGLTELVAELRALPEACAGEAAKLIEGTANGVYVAIKGDYPTRTGNLRKGMKLSTVTKKGLVVGAVVKNTAPHATIWELGTQARHTSIGANRGSMPPGHNFIPKVVKARRRLTQELKDMVARHGATVSGEP